MHYHPVTPFFLFSFLIFLLFILLSAITLIFLALLSFRSRFTTMSKEFRNPKKIPPNSIITNNNNNNTPNATSSRSHLKTYPLSSVSEEITDNEEDSSCEEEETAVTKKQSNSKQTQIQNNTCLFVSDYLTRFRIPYMMFVEDGKINIQPFEMINFKHEMFKEILLTGGGGSIFLSSTSSSGNTKGNQGIIHSQSQTASTTTTTHVITTPPLPAVASSSSSETPVAVVPPTSSSTLSSVSSADTSSCLDHSSPDFSSLLNPALIREISFLLVDWQRKCLSEVNVYFMDSQWRQVMEILYEEGYHTTFIKPIKVVTQYIDQWFKNQKNNPLLTVKGGREGESQLKEKFLFEKEFKKQGRKIEELSKLSGKKRKMFF